MPRMLAISPASCGGTGAAGANISIDIQVRHPGISARLRPVFTAGVAVLYTALAALVLAWAWRGEWFDAYDALLWLIAFATIEINILRNIRRESAPLQAAPEYASLKALAKRE